MIKKTIFCFTFLLCAGFIFAQQLPTPKNNQMYTEYTSEKKVKYVKKPIISTGKIIMFDKNSFVFTQDSPAAFTVTKKNNTITYKRPNMSAMQFDANDKSFTENSDFQIMSFFDGNASIDTFYNIQQNVADGINHYVVTPKNPSKISEIRITAQDDKLSTLIIVFSDNSTLKYTFKNTITGVKPTYEDSDK